MEDIQILIVDDDPKGVGPFMMAYAQYLQLKKEIQ